MQKLCCVRTRQHPLPVWSHNLSLTNLLISPSILIHFRWELYQINKSHRSTPKLTSRIKALFNENFSCHHQKSSILLSPTTKFNLIPSDQIKDPLRLPKQQIGSEQVPPHLPHLASTELEGFFQSFKVLLQPSNELKIIFHSNLSSTTLLLDKHSSTVSTTSTGLGYLTSILWRLASTHPLTTVLSQKSL